MLSDDLQALKSLFVNLQGNVRLDSIPHSSDVISTKRPPRPGMDILFTKTEYPAERGLLQHARKVHARCPTIPHFRVFQLLDHVYTLIIELDPPIIWARRLGTCFVHLYPTPTSLTPSRPFAPLQTLTRFILRFRNLENLCLE